MSEERTEGSTPGFRDRKVGLVAFGIIQLVLGALSLLAVPFMLVGAVASARSTTPPLPASSVAPGVLFYVLLAAWFIVMGIGSIRARRWARALLLVTAWFWLVSGLAGLAFMLAFLNDLYGSIGAGGEMPAEMAATMRAVMKVFMLGFMVLFYVFLPGAFVLFYGSRHTKATCEQRDARVRWTDRCPLPVLGVSLMLAAWALCMPMAGLYRWSFAYFGTVLTGPAGAAVMLALAGFLLVMAWGLYRLRLAAWWGALLLVTGLSISMIVTFARLGLMGLYEQMGMPEQQMAMIRQMKLPGNEQVLLFSGLWALVALGYLAWIRRFFGKTGGAA